MTVFKVEIPPYRELLVNRNDYSGKKWTGKKVDRIIFEYETVLFLCISGGITQDFSRSHAPHGNAFWMRRIQVESFISVVCNGLQRRPRGVPMRRMGTRQSSPVFSIIEAEKPGPGLAIKH